MRKQGKKKHKWRKHRVGKSIDGTGKLTSLLVLAFLCHRSSNLRPGLFGGKIDIYYFYLTLINFNTL